MGTALATPIDRRARRRLETIDEVLGVAVDVMAEQGVAGLSLGEVARRMGMRTPSLYVYFPSKHALYDALFERGARLFRDAVLSALPEGSDQVGSDGAAVELTDLLIAVGEGAVRWAVENPTYAHLLFWRPVPGFEPSPQAYAPAVEVATWSTQQFAELQRMGLIRPDVRPEDLFRDWTILTGGVVSQQLSNGPGESYGKGAFTQRLPAMAAMFASLYATQPSGPTPPDSQSSRRGRHVGKR
jgi:AcrR family transcriptional regulator